MDKSNIRNFCIIAHIDHGKSTLSDRLLELTHTIPSGKLLAQHLDQNPIERERGITIKLAPVRMNYELNAIRYVSGKARKESSAYTLNLIDTPGHVDFSYEVSRSLAAVEGAILLVDATSGIQAQTISNMRGAKEQNLTIIPVINKIDHPAADVKKTTQDMIDVFGFTKEEIYSISAKTGENVEKLIEVIIAKIPPPKGDSDKSLKALIFDSAYDAFKGVITHVRIFDGTLKKGDEIFFMGNQTSSQAIEAGIFLPHLKATDALSAGEIGYVATGLKDVSSARVGDTITQKNNPTSYPVAGYKEVKPMVFAAFYPTDSRDFPHLREALFKLKLNDASLSFEPEYSQALGSGFRIGFLGLLHREIVQERLEREYDLSLIASLPTVEYQVALTNGETISIARPGKLPDPSHIKEIREPFIKGKIISPKEYIGSIIELITRKRGEISDMQYQGNQVTLSLRMPMAEIVIDFYDRLKNISSGFASFDYELLDFRKTQVVKLDILVAGESIDALSQIVVEKNAAFIGRKFVEKLKEAIPRQQFEVAIQAAIGGKIVARADIASFRKDVTAKLYGGDRTRKDKLLEAQKKGKKRMKMVGKIEIPQEAFLSVLKI